MMDAVDIAWVTGIVEGEGCIRVPKLANRHYPSVQVRMTDRDIIYRLQEITGVGSITEVEPQESRHKKSWNWAVTKRQDVARLLCAMVPLLGERRRSKALEAAEALHRNFIKQVVAKCGTRSGYNRHRRLGEECCEACSLAQKEYRRTRALSKTPGTPHASIDEHGTAARAKRHYANGEKPCEPCRIALNKYDRNRDKGKRNK